MSLSKLHKLCLFTILILCGLYSPCTASIYKKDKISITVTQSLYFGAFCLSGTGGGTVSVRYDGARTSTGGILLLSMPPFAQASEFDIILCNKYNLKVTFAATCILSGSNGGYLTLNIGPSDKGVSGSSFTINGNCNIGSPFKLGGTLHVPGSAIPGTYSGFFEITVNQE